MSDANLRLVVGKPNIMDKEGFLRDVEEILETRIFTNMGPFSVKLEREVCSFLNVKHCVAVSNATVGLAMALRVLDLEPGSEVIVPAYTFIATAHAVTECGLKVVFCDCNPTSHLIDRKSVSDKISCMTSAIVAVNLWGLACDVEDLQDLARENGLKLMFDSAHAFGARAPSGTFLGNFGDIEVFSMHATKLFNSFEGGLLTTNDDDLAVRLKSMRNFGITGQDTVSSWGSNYKLSEIHAAFALRQLNKIEELIEVYQENARIYTDELNTAEIQGLRNWNKTYVENQGCTHSYVCLEVTPEFPVDRDEVVNFLRSMNIYAKRYFFPGLQNCEPYSSDLQPELPVTEMLCKEVIVLPTGTLVTKSHIRHIVSLIQSLDLSLKTKSLELLRKPIEVDRSSLTERLMYLRKWKCENEANAASCERDIKAIEQELKGTRER
jgi:dTDP-4-amino-4,6-dideoxygalactose transaminase